MNKFMYELVTKNDINLSKQLERDIKEVFKEKGIAVEEGWEDSKIKIPVKSDSSFVLYYDNQIIADIGKLEERNGVMYREIKGR